MIGLRNRRGVAAGSILLLVLVGLGLGQALRDGTPPSLWIETPARAIAGEAMEVRVSADEPASYRVEYGDGVHEQVDQDLVLTLEVLPGDVPIRITATDAAGNRSEAERSVFGAVVPRGTLEIPPTVRPGDPYTVVLRLEPADAERSDVAISGAGAPLVAWPSDEGAFALGAVPLEREPGPLPLEARWRDVLGRESVVTGRSQVVPLGQEIEQLTLSQATLSVITPEGRALEESALAAAVADPTDPPLWKEPFLLPIEGRGTSGFGHPRRYAPGGPVSFHVGEDIAAPTGTPILATNDGVVRLAGVFPIKGGLTVIDHGAGVTSRYYHQSTIDVSEGQRVVRGERIGAVGSTGLSTGPHLHWEMRVADVPTYPMAWVGRTRP